MTLDFGWCVVTPQNVKPYTYEVAKLLHARQGEAVPRTELQAVAGKNLANALIQLKFLLNKTHDIDHVGQILVSGTETVLFHKYSPDFKFVAVRKAAPVFSAHTLIDDGTRRPDPVQPKKNALALSVEDKRKLEAERKANEEAQELVKSRPAFDALRARFNAAQDANDERYEAEAEAARIEGERIAEVARIKAAHALLTSRTALFNAISGMAAVKKAAEEARLKAEAARQALEARNDRRRAAAERGMAKYFKDKASKVVTLVTVPPARDLKLGYDKKRPALPASFNFGDFKIEYKVDKAKPARINGSDNKDHGLTDVEYGVLIYLFTHRDFAPMRGKHLADVFFGDANPPHQNPAGTIAARIRGIRVALLAAGYKNAESIIKTEEDGFAYRTRAEQKAAKPAKTPALSMK